MKFRRELSCAAVAVASVASVGLFGCGSGSDGSPEGTVECPGTPTRCSPGDCCAGFDATDQKSFPCPTSDLMTTTCEAGREVLVEALLASMTRQEKYKFVRGTGWNNYEILSGFYIGNAGGQQRFGIPSLNMHDNGNGFNNIDITNRAYDEKNLSKTVEQITSFPVSLNLAATWSEDMARTYGIALGQEFRDKGANVVLGPAIEVHRVPTNGRNVEYLSGESPYLGARLVKPLIRGIQSQKVLASAKHFVGNHQEECRRTSDSIIDARTRFEMYYPPFEAAIEADVAMHMCGYNKVNGVWNCGSDEILKQDLRQALGFKGWVQSDWWAFHSFELGLDGGVDQEMPGTGVDWEPDRNTHYTDTNLDTLDDTKINSMVRPQLDYMLKYGLFEPDETSCLQGECSAKLIGPVVTTPERQSLARDMATSAMTLLKNDGVLPLAGSSMTIAVLGSACNVGMDWDAASQWFATTYYSIGGSGRVLPKDPITIFEGITTMCEQEGCNLLSDFSDDSTAAVAAAAGADVAILCGGVGSAEEVDRATLHVDAHEFLVNTSAALSMPTVVLTMTAGAILMPWIQDVAAAVTVFNPGKYGGAAFADVLFGKVNPSAKSPVMHPKTETGTTKPVPCAAQGEITVVNYTEGLCTTWHCFDPANVLFPFGHGLSYTSWSYADMKIETVPERVSAECPNQDPDKGGAVLCITATVTNAGARAGVEIAQLYMKYPDGLGEPPKVLRGFHRLGELESGASAVAHFPIYRRDLQTYSPDDRAWRDEVGTYTFYVSASAGDERLVEDYAKSASPVLTEALV